MFAEGESTEFAGKAVVALATDPNVHRKTGRTLITADLASEYGFNDIDGREIQSMRSLTYLLKALNLGVANYLPNWLKVPGWMMVATQSRL